VLGVHRSICAHAQRAAAPSTSGRARLAHELEGLAVNDDDDDDAIGIARGSLRWRQVSLEQLLATRIQRQVPSGNIGKGTRALAAEPLADTRSLVVQAALRAKLPEAPCSAPLE
jgi:hypothetical protein